MSWAMRQAMKRAMKRAIAAVMLLAVPTAARACAACGAGVDRNRSIFLFTTILLSLLPLVLVGSGLLWIALRSRERLAAEFGEREEPFVTTGVPAGAGAGTHTPGGGPPAVAAPTGGRGA
jgi:hypothetical protein